MTLLELVQDILSDLNSDEVGSISDTVEAQQVAQTVKTTFYNIIHDDNYPEHYNINTLTANADLNHPSYMQLPTNCLNIEWVMYDSHTTDDPAISYLEIPYFSPEKFLKRVLSRLSTDDNILTINDPSGVKLLIQNDKFPEYYTSFDDNTLVFDSYSAVDEDTLTAARSLIYSSTEPLWEMDDDFIPDLDANMFPLLLAEAKSLCFVNNTQSSNAKVEQVAKRHQSRKQSRMHRVLAANTSKRPDFGRKKS